MSDEPEPRESKRSIASLLFKALTWFLSAGCFYLVYTKIDGAASRDGITVLQYLQDFFSGVNWWLWLAVMIPYSFFFFLVDTHVTWRAIRWFNAPALGFTKILPIRASAYILALVNEQVGKGAMSLYLLKTYKVPGWQALSTMIFIGIVEIYQLLMFSTVGVVLRFDYVQQASTMLPLDVILPCVLVGALVYFPVHFAFFRGYIFKRSKLREIGVLHALRNAKLWHYGLAVLFKAPNLIGAVIVYAIALNLFQVEATVGQMLIFLPLIFLAAALPLPFHAGALLLWTVLFPDYPEVGAFSLVMHTFFVLFNALIGVAFLPRANKELFG
ncbi:MAG: hypothetical protein OXG24_11325 [Gammaproteobacteria bacterium]|nr:hypothetical protein [Gammaproteobacteria bacterium]